MACISLESRSKWGGNSIWYGQKTLLRSTGGIILHGPLNTAAPSGLNAGFFVGCVIDKVFPDGGRAVLRSLEHNGVGIAVPDNQGCCAIPALASGDAKTFRELVRHNVERFSALEFDSLVTARATCTSTVRKPWPLFREGLSARDRGRALAMPDKTLDISRFLVDKIGIESIGSPKSCHGTFVACHDPCHLKKSLGAAAERRKFLEADPAHSFAEMREADRCCGCGGSFNLRHYGISSASGKRKRGNIVNSGCGVIATGCPACMLRISDMLSRAGDRIQVKHAVEIYASSLKGDSGVQAD